MNDLLLNLFSDSRGTLGSIEFGDLPFIPQRFYWITLQEKKVRGKHAHKKLEQLIFVLEGQVEFRTFRGQLETRSILERGEYLLIGSSVWREFQSLGEMAVLGCLASQPYSESDYIRDFEEYLEHYREIL